MKFRKKPSDAMELAELIGGAVMLDPTKQLYPDEVHYEIAWEQFLNEVASELDAYAARRVEEATGPLREKLESIKSMAVVSKADTPTGLVQLINLIRLNTEKALILLAEEEEG